MRRDERPITRMAHRHAVYVRAEGDGASAGGGALRAHAQARQYAKEIIDAATAHATA